ncbi:aminotransferase class III-fold pyridoxal phosphate-dependent enzyme, partial [Turicimonas muris]
MSNLMNTYGRLPVEFDHGQGVWLWDKEGNKYLDALAGIAVNAVGHAHPRLVKAISDQASKLIHCSNYFQISLQEQVAAKLLEHSGLDAVFFCNSGLEANECAFKIARKYGHQKGIKVPTIVVLKKAFHGRSISTLSATG